MLTARVVVPTPPFGEKKVTISPVGRSGRAASGVTRPARISSASTCAASSWRAKPSAHHVVGAGLQEGDPGLDVIGRRDHEDGRRLGCARSGCARWSR